MHHLLFLPRSVTQSKPVPLAAWQANKSRDEVLGWGITTLSGKLACREDGRLTSWRSIFPQVRTQAPFILKRGGGVVGCCKLLGVGGPADFQRTNVIFHSAAFYLDVNGKVLHPWRSEPWEQGTLCISGCRQHCFTKRAEPARLSTGETEQG